MIFALELELMLRRSGQAQGTESPVNRVQDASQTRVEVALKLRIKVDPSQEAEAHRP